MKFNYLTMLQIFIHQFHSIDPFNSFEFLQDDYAELKKRAKLNLTDIQQLLELCLIESHFLCNNVILTLENSGRIALSIIVILTECYLQRIEHISITQALDLNLAPKTFKRFVDDFCARVNNREQSLQFLDILKNQDSLIQYTTEFENENKQLNFLDITISNTGNNSYNFKIFRKTSITNVQIKPNSNIAPQKIFFQEHTKYVLKSIS